MFKKYMLQRILFILLFVVSTLDVAAVPAVTGAGRYHLVCTLYQNGCVTLGSSSGQQTPVYYLSTATTADETYWILTKQDDDSFTIQNAKTKKYVTYDGERIEAYKRYVDLTDADMGDNSHWRFNVMNDGSYEIRCVGATGHLWDVRANSMIVGTYEAQNAASNQRFYIVDQSGNRVGEYVNPNSHNLTTWLVANENDMKGWTTSEFNLNTGAGGSHYSTVNDGAYLVQPFIESWKNRATLGTDELSQTLTNIPKGTYTLEASIIATNQYFGVNVSNVNFYLNNSTVALSTPNNDPRQYSITAEVTDGTISLGLSLQNTSANWVAIDNIRLLFHGTQEELLAAELEKFTADASMVYSADEVEAMKAECLAAYNDIPSQFAALEELRLIAMKQIEKLQYRPKPTPLDEAFDNLFFNERGMPYDTRNGQYMYSVEEADMNTDFTAVVTYAKKDGWGDLSINNVKVFAGDSYKFSSISAGKTYTLKATKLDNSQSITAKVTFTSLPVVEVCGEFGNEYADGYIRVYENNKTQPELFNTRMKWRGGITNSNGKHKRNYNIKLYKENGDKKNKKFFGLRDDNRWILDAGQVDMSRVRNRVLTELWLDFCHKPYYFDLEPKALSAVRGTMVEVTLNGSYQGVYHMTERLDRKQMKLMDYDDITQTHHGQLWKGKDWSYAVFMGHYSDNNNYPKTKPASYNNNSDWWEAYTVEYPDFDDVNPTDWSTLYNAVELIASKSEREIYEQFCDYFDYPVFLDYYILMEATLATDNHGKNAYYGVYDKQTDKKITISVWDMDATLGQRWSDDYYHSSLMKPEQDYAEYITNHEHGDWNLFRMLRYLNINDFNEKVRYRYRELRNGPLHTDSVCARFEAAIGKMKDSGAAAREKARWSGDTDISRLTLDFDNELAFIKDWVARRLNYLDKTRFNIDELPPLGISDVAMDCGYSLNLSGHSIIIDAARPQTINIYTSNGVLARSVKASAGVNEVNGLPCGVYIIGKKKVIVR